MAVQPLSVCVCVWGGLLGQELNVQTGPLLVKAAQCK